MGETVVQMYQQAMLQVGVKHLKKKKLFSCQEWVFHQKSVPTQKIKPTQEWLWRNFLAFISSKIGLQGVQTSKP